MMSIWDWYEKIGTGKKFVVNKATKNLNFIVMPIIFVQSERIERK